MKAEDTFSTKGKSHQLTTTQLNVIADDIHRAITRPRNEDFVTRRQRQIDFMWHLYGQGFTAKEISSIYNLPVHTVENVLDRRFKKKYA